MTPAVSVIVPAHRVTAYIAQTLDSVLAQTRRDFEIVVVNDGCPDTLNLERVLAPYRERIVYQRQAWGGPSTARNAAIALARGPLLAFLDADDLWTPTFLEVMLPILESDPACVMAFADTQPFGVGAHSNSLLAQAPPQGVCDLAGILVGRHVVFTSTTVTRRQAVIDAGGFDPALQHCEDYDLWLRLAARGTVVCEPQVLGRRRLRPGSQSSSASTMLRAQMAVRRRVVAAASLPADVVADAAAADHRCEAEIALDERHRAFLAGDWGAGRAVMARLARALWGRVVARSGRAAR
jgi:glycosyltransferase involved in cell wall biosynthesis